MSETWFSARSVVRPGDSSIHFLQKKGFVNGTQIQTLVALVQPFRCPPVQGWCTTTSQAPGTMRPSSKLWELLHTAVLPSQRNCTAVSMASHHSVNLALSHY